MNPQQEFKALIAAAEREYDSNKKQLNLGSWDTRELIYALALMGVWVVGILARAIDNPQAPHAETVQHCFTLIKGEPKWRLLQISSKSYQPRDLLLLYFRLLVLDDLHEELCKRTPGPVGRALIQISKTADNPLLVALRIDSLRDFENNDSRKKNNSDDLRNDVVRKFFERFKAMRVNAVSNRRAVLVPEIIGRPSKLYGPKWSDWEQIEAHLMASTEAFFDAVLSGDIERIPEALRNWYREIFRKRKRHEDILQGREDFSERGPESWREDWDLAERAATYRWEDISSETSGNIPGPEDELAEREIRARAYHHVLSRWGNRGVRFLDELIASEGNVLVASEAAGISRPTGHKWRIEIRKLVPEGNPSK
jgi:hypothetical protein